MKKQVKGKRKTADNYSIQSCSQSSVCCESETDVSCNEILISQFHYKTAHLYSFLSCHVTTTIIDFLASLGFEPSVRIDGRVDLKLNVLVFFWRECLMC